MKIKYVYEVGDIVYIKDDLSTDRFYDGYVLPKGMLQFRGKKAKVVWIDYENDPEAYFLDIDKEKYEWRGDMLISQLEKQNMTYYTPNPHCKQGYDMHRFEGSGADRFFFNYNQAYYNKEEAIAAAKNMIDKK